MISPSTRIRTNPSRFVFLDHITEFAALVPHQRREQNDFRFLRICKNLIDNLLRRLPEDGPPGQRIVRLPYRRKKDPQIIVNLRRGRDNGARDSFPRSAVR